MAGPILLCDIAIILGALVDIPDLHGDRRAGRHQRSLVRFVRQDAGEDRHLIGLAALGHEARGSGLSAIEFGLNLLDPEANSGRAPIDHASDRGAVALAPGGDAEEVSEGVVRHGKPTMKTALHKGLRPVGAVYRMGQCRIKPHLQRIVIKGSREKTQLGSHFPLARRFGWGTGRQGSIRGNSTMTRRIIAFFATSFLSVAMTIPAFANEADGVIVDIDSERSQLRLSDGQTYLLPEDFDYGAVKPGMAVVVIYDEAQGYPSQNVYSLV